MTRADANDNNQNALKFNEIYQRYQTTLYSVAISIVKNPYDAEDVVQDSALKIIQILHRIEPDDIPLAKCKNLMITIAKNTAIDYLRRKNHEVVDSELLTEKTNDKSAEDIYFETADYKNLVQCIAQLDDNYLDVLRLKGLFHLSSKEAARLLNTTEININMRYMRAKKQLALKLSERKQS